MAVSKSDFVVACLKAKSIQDIVDATGLSRATVQQKRVALRNAGVAIPQLQKGAGRKATPTDFAALNAMIAEQLGKPVEEVTAEGAKLVENHGERLAKKAATETVAPPADTATEPETTQAAE